MKIVHISTYPPKGEKHPVAGGVASYTKNLVTNTSYASITEVSVLCNILTSPEQYNENEITIRRCFNNSRFFFQLLKAVNKIKPDVIHIQQELNLFGGPVTAYLLQWLVFLLAKQSRVIITLHGVVDLKKVDSNFVRENNSSLPAALVRTAFRLIYVPLCRFANEIIVHEEKFKEILVSDYRVKPDKVVVIQHGVEDLQAVDTTIARRKLGIEPEKHAVLFMGYLTGYKGLDILIEGFSEYAKTDPFAYLLIGAGKHPKLKSDPNYIVEYDRLVRKASDLIPANQYAWKGFIEEKDIALYYSACDVSVYPYTIQMSSSGPMALAIGYGKPFFGSSAFEGDLEPDLIFGKDSRDLAKALGHYFSTDRRAVQDLISKKREQLAWPHIAELYADLYREII